MRETLRQAILNGDLKGGSRLVQADLARELDVSTTPVREALRDLDAEGLIRLDAHRGGIVHELSQEELAEIYGLRAILEVEAMRRASSRITPEQLTIAESIHEQMLAAPHSASWVMLNRDFHLAIYEAADSPKLLSILTSLLDASVHYVSANIQGTPEVRKIAGNDHAQILKFLRQGDSDKAEAAIKHHLEISGSMLNS